MCEYMTREINLYGFLATKLMKILLPILQYSDGLSSIKIFIDLKRHQYIQLRLSLGELTYHHALSEQSRWTWLLLTFFIKSKHFVECWKNLMPNFRQEIYEGDTSICI